MVSSLISLRLASVFYHSSIEFPEEGLIYQSNFSHGVHRVPTKEVKEPYVTIDVEVTDDVYSLCFFKANMLVGLKYDVKAIIGFFFSKLKQNPDKMFCSEFSYEIFKVISGEEFKLYNLISPGQLRYLIMGYLAGIKTKP